MSSQSRPSRPRRSNKPFKRYSRPRVCQFCADKSIDIDYKNIALLRRFLSENGKIRPRRQTGTCAKHQRKLALEIKRALGIWQCCHLPAKRCDSEGISNGYSSR